MRQRHYVDGKLVRSAAGNPETLRKWLDNMQREWSKHLGPLVQPGEFDPNNGHTVERVSIDELIVVTTGGRVLRTVNVEGK